MTTVLCECGHPQDRHVYGVGHCTFNTPKTKGVGFVACNCLDFKLGNPLYKQVIESIDPNAR